MSDLTDKINKLKISAGAAKTAAESEKVESSAPKKKMTKAESAAAARKAFQEKRATEITPQIELFCQEYIIDLNGTHAAIRAGYSKTSAHVQASRLLSSDKVVKRLQELMKARSERTQVTQDYVLTTIVETVERCRQSVRPKFNGQDQAIVETPNGEGLAFVFDAGSVLKGAELLGRHLKMFTDKVEQSGPNNGPIEHIHSEMDPKRASELYKQAVSGRQI